jgi:peroxiredoxin
MRQRFLLPAILMGAVAIAAVGANSPVPSAKLGQAAPAFMLSDQNGKPTSLAEYAGKIVVLAWFNPDCPFVQRHLKANTFTTLANKYKDKDVVVLGIDSSFDHTVAGNLKAVQSLGLNFALLSDASGAVGHLYDAKTTPEMYVVNKDGSLAYEGGIDNDPDGTLTTKIQYVDQAIDELLAGKSVSVAETKSYGCHVHYTP